MHIEVIRKPVFCLKINDFFPDKINKSILKESISLKKTFTDAIIGKGLDKSYRNNKVAYYDTIYQNDRSKSFLLSALDGKFKNDEEFREILSTSPLPIGDFLMTTTHETQVSRYGNGEHYEWHQDRFANLKRHITLVYYFNSIPQKWSGGTLSLTDSPANKGKLIEKSPNILQIKPENNMALIFSSTALHMVEKTISQKEFSLGRFSANIWIGMR